MSKTTPTIRMVLEKYPRIAAVERIRNGRPGTKSVSNAIVNVKRVCQLGDLSLDEPVSVLTCKRLTKILDGACLTNLKRVSIWGYMVSFQSLFAKWTRPYYLDENWQTPTIILPSCNRQPPRYIRPDPAILEKVKKWYKSLESLEDGRAWVAATLMLEFAMRNGDVAALRWADFRQKDNAVSLCYTPHKTALSSGRRVAWPVHNDIWLRLGDYRETCTELYRRRGANGVRDESLVVPCANEVFDRMNKDLRSQNIFTGSKGCYELRKICIDHVYQKFGAEMASSISGDDIRTMMRYYADPSQPNIGDVRIIDLI